MKWFPCRKPQVKEPPHVNEFVVLNNDIDTNTVSIMKLIADDLRLWSEIDTLFLNINTDGNKVFIVDNRTPSVSYVFDKVTHLFHIEALSSLDWCIAYKNISILDKGNQDMVIEGMKEMVTRLVPTHINISIIPESLKARSLGIAYASLHHQHEELITLTPFQLTITPDDFVRITFALRIPYVYYTGLIMPVNDCRNGNPNSD